MSKQLWHFVDPVTGIGTGMSVYDTAEAVERNLPSGLAVWCSPSFDHLAERVDWEQHCVVPYQPPPPPDTELVTWSWSTETRRWVSAPTLLARQQRCRAERDRRMADSDWVTLRAIRTGQPIPSDWAAYMQALADVPEQPGFPDSITWPTPPSP